VNISTVPFSAISGAVQIVGTAPGVLYKNYDHGYLNKEKELSGTNKHAPTSYIHYLSTFELTGSKENSGASVSPFHKSDPILYWPSSNYRPLEEF
jgi:hypothetical protein